MLRPRCPRRCVGFPAWCPSLAYKTPKDRVSDGNHGAASGLRPGGPNRVPALRRPGMQVGAAAAVRPRPLPTSPVPGPAPVVPGRRAMGWDSLGRRSVSSLESSAGATKQATRAPAARWLQPKSLVASSPAAVPGAWHRPCASPAATDSLRARCRPPVRSGLASGGGGCCAMNHPHRERPRRIPLRFVVCLHSCEPNPLLGCKGTPPCPEAKPSFPVAVVVELGGAGELMVPIRCPQPRGPVPTGPVHSAAAYGPRALSPGRGTRAMGFSPGHHHDVGLQSTPPPSNPSRPEAGGTRCRASYFFLGQSLSYLVDLRGCSQMGGAP